MQIIPGKNRTIHLLLESEFPPLKSTDNKPTPYVTPKTIAYIHGLICDSITLFHSDACNARALRNVIMILEVLEEQEPAVFRQDTLVHYYEEIQGMHGAAGRPRPKSFKHKMKTAKSRAAPAEAAGGESTEGAPEAPPPDDGGGGAEPPAAAAAAAPAGLEAGKRRKGSAKTQ